MYCPTQIWVLNYSTVNLYDTNIFEIPWQIYNPHKNAAGIFPAAFFKIADLNFALRSRHNINICRCGTVLLQDKPVRRAEDVHALVKQGRIPALCNGFPASHISNPGNLHTASFRIGYCAGEVDGLAGPYGSAQCQF